jgi:hypothetical protein
MKKHTLILPTLASLLMALTVHADFPGAVVSDNPLAYYRFEEVAGATTLADSSGNGLDIDYSAPIGTTELGVAGAVGLGALFNGDESILTPFLLDPSIGDFTIEAVVQAGTTVGDGVIIANQDGTLGPGRSNLIVNANRQFTSFSGGGVTNSGVTVTDVGFDHVILTYDQSASVGGVDPTFRFYVNGVEAGTSLAIAEAANGNWVIGSNKVPTSQLFSGVVDEIAVYGTRLDDPNGDGDLSDSRTGAHYKEFLADSETLVTFEGSVPYLDSGQSADLSWLVSPALTSLTLDEGTGPVDVLGQTTGCLGGTTVSPTATTTYTLEGTGPLGTEMLEILIVVDEAAVIDDFGTSSSVAVPGGNVVLSWVVTNGITVEIDNGVGAVDASSGSTTVAVTEPTTFTLTANNSQGPVTAEVFVGIAVGEFGLVAHWKVGEATGELDGTTLIAESGVDFNGTFVGNPIFDTADTAPLPGGSSASIVFDGAGSWVEVTGFTGIGGSAARTVAFWFKGDAAQANLNANLVGWGTGGTGNRFDTRINTVGVGQIRTEVAGSGSNGTAPITDNTWHHCAVVVDPTIGTTIGDIQFYIDGVLDPLTATGGTEINSTTTNPVLIGSSPGIAGRALTGKMDDIRIYNRALSSEEVEKLSSQIDVTLEVIAIRRLENGNVELDWSGAPGDYIFEYSRNLTSWTEISDSEVIAEGETSATSIDNSIAPDAANPKIFYRFRPLD